MTTRELIERLEEKVRRYGEAVENAPIQRKDLFLDGSEELVENVVWMGDRIVIE